MKKRNILALLILSCAVLSCSLENLFPKTETETIKFPSDVKSAEIYDPFVEEDFVVVRIPVNNEFYLGKDKIAKESLGAEISRRVQMKPAAEQIVYLKADGDVSYENIIEILKSARAKNISDFGLLVKKEVNKKELTSRILVKNNVEGFPLSPPSVLSSKQSSEPIAKPNPLTLIASLDKDGKLKLNSEEMTLESLESRLSEILKLREENAIFKEKTNEIEKTVFIKAPLSAKYNDVMKLIDAVNAAKANPICLIIQDLTQ